MITDDQRKNAFLQDVQLAMQKWGVSISFKPEIRQYGTMVQTDIKVEYPCDPNWTPPQGKTFDPASIETAGGGTGLTEDAAPHIANAQPNGNGHKPHPRRRNRATPNP